LDGCRGQEGHSEGITRCALLWLWNDAVFSWLHVQTHSLWCPVRAIDVLVSLLYHERDDVQMSATLVILHRRAASEDEALSCSCCALCCSRTKAEVEMCLGFSH
jgi:hypothetical protein